MVPNYVIRHNFCLDEWISLKFGGVLDIIKRNNSVNFEKNPTTWRHVTSFLILAKKCADVSKNERTKTLISLYYLKSSIYYLSNKGSTVFIRQLETKLSSFKKCRIFMTSSSKYDVTMTSRRIFWRQSKVY